MGAAVGGAGGLGAAGAAGAGGLGAAWRSRGPGPWLSGKGLEPGWKARSSSEGRGAPRVPSGGGGQPQEGADQARLRPGSPGAAATREASVAAVAVRLTRAVREPARLRLPEP